MICMVTKFLFVTSKWKSLCSTFWAAFCRWWCEMSIHYYTPYFNKVGRGYTGFTLSVCPSVDRIVSALCLQQYLLDQFHICTSYQATSDGVSCVMSISKLKKLKFWPILLIDFVFIWLGIQYDSIEWVIMRQWGYPQNAGILVALVLNYFAVHKIWN